MKKEDRLKLKQIKNINLRISINIVVVILQLILEVC